MISVPKEYTLEQLANYNYDSTKMYFDACMAGHSVDGLKKKSSPLCGAVKSRAHKELLQDIIQYLADKYPEVANKLQFRKLLMELMFDAGYFG